MRKMLALVVAGAACKKRFSFDARLEWRRLPKIEWLGRLNVVMAIYQELRLARGRHPGRARDDNGIPFCRIELRFQSYAFAFLDEPLGAAFDILLVLRLGRDAWKAHVIAEFLYETFLVGFEIIENSLHVVLVALVGAGCSRVF